MKYLDTAKRGKFIVVYGPSNVGKSTQVSMLVSKLVTEYHTQVLLIKYPVYGLEPTGEEILKIVKKEIGFILMMEMIIIIFN